MKQVYGAVLALAIMVLPALGLAADAPTAPAVAAAPSPSTLLKGAPAADRIAVLKPFKDQGVTATFIGRKFGLDGWLLVKDDSLQVIYTTPDGQGGVLGTLYGPTGELETGKQLLAAKQKGWLPANITGSPDVASIAPAPSTDTTPAAARAPAGKGGELPSEKLWKQLSASSYLKFGSDTAPPFYVFMDPRCEFCHTLYTTISDQYLTNNTMQMRVIPVGILGPESTKEANQILSGADGAKLWDQMEHINTTELIDVVPNAEDKMNKNHDIMRDWKMNGTPACIYRGKDGKVKIVMGIPADMNAVIADLGPDRAR